MRHMMSPTGVAVVLLLALVVDYTSIGPDSIRDRIAFLIGLPAIREGFAGGPLDTWTVGLASKGIDALKSAAHGSYIAGAATSVILSAAVGVLAMYTVGALLPSKLSRRLGRFATIRFRSSGLHHLNWHLWTCAALLGVLANLPQGGVGGTLRGSIDWLDAWVALLPSLLFGVK